MANIKLEEVSVTKRMYGWSKYGGANHGYVQEDLPEWYCQACGDKQTSEMPSYYVPMDTHNRDFVRVCSVCKHEMIKRDFVLIDQMLEELRDPSWFDTYMIAVENLLTQSRII